MSLSLLSQASAQTFYGICQTPNKEYQNAMIQLGYVNLGTEEEPEFCWTIHGVRDLETGEVDDMYFFSGNAKWVHDDKRQYFDNDKFIMVKNLYQVRPSGKNTDIIEIGTFGGEFISGFLPRNLLISIFSPEGVQKAVYFIPYSEENSDSLYESIITAIDTMGMKEVK